MPLLLTTCSSVFTMDFRRVVEREAIATAFGRLSL